MSKRRYILRFLVLLYFLLSPVALSYILSKLNDVTRLEIIEYNKDHILLAAVRARNSTFDTYLIQNYQFNNTSYSIEIYQLNIPNISNTLFEELRIIFDASFIYSDVTKVDVKFEINKTNSIREEISQIYLIGGFLIKEYWFLRGRKLKEINNIEVGKLVSFYFGDVDRVYLDAADYLAITFRFDNISILRNGSCVDINITFWRQIILIPKLFFSFFVQISFIFLNFLMLWAYNLAFIKESKR